MVVSKNSLRAALGALVVAIVLPAGAAEFRSADIHPDGYPTVEAVKRLGEQFTKATGGRHTVKVFSKGALGSEKDVIEQTRQGTIAMARVNIAAMNNVCAETIVPTMPFLFRSKEHLHKTLDGAIGEEILKSCEEEGFIGLAYYDSGARSIYTAKKPVRTVADAKGLKIRVQQSDLWVSLLESMGATAAPMPLGEVQGALKSGAVDGAENNYPSYESSRHFEVAKYYSKTEHSMAPEMLLFSKKVWDTLSPADQQALRQAAKDSVPYMRKLWDEREEKSLAAVKAGGAEIIEVEKASFRNAVKPVYLKFLREPKLLDLFKRIQEVQ
jgi:tripartite ATP-independent transporter DctP family solute receptor